MNVECKEKIRRLSIEIRMECRCGAAEKEASQSYDQVCREIGSLSRQRCEKEY